MNSNRLHISLLRCLKLDHLVILLLALPSLAVAEAESHPPKASAQETEIQLVEFSRKSAEKAGLTIAQMRIVAIGAAEQPLQRRRFQIKVTGPPKPICGWLEDIHDIDKFRAIAYLRIGPQRGDPSLMDCTVEINQWFVSKDAAAEPKEVDGLWRRTVKNFSARLSPVAVWGEIQKCIPGDSDLRLAWAEITDELDMTPPKPNQISIDGEGKPLSAVNRFGENLKRSKSLDGYQWQIPPPQEVKGGEWSFQITATSDKPPR